MCWELKSSPPSVRTQVGKLAAVAGTWATTATAAPPANVTAAAHANHRRLPIAAPGSETPAPTASSETPRRAAVDNRHHL
jgi:hypothetical protein